VFWSAGVWFCQQHLFPWSSFSFGSVWFVRRRYISPGLSLASERVSERVSILHLRISANLVPFVIALLFFPSLVLSLGTNKNKTNHVRHVLGVIRTCMQANTSEQSDSENIPRTMMEVQNARQGLRKREETEEEEEEEEEEKAKAENKKKREAKREKEKEK